MSIRELLEGLPFVASRRLNGRDGFFTAGRMFALLSDTSLLLRLPAPAGEALVEADRVQALVGPPVATQPAWVEIPLPAPDLDEIHHLMLTSHQAVRSVSRQARRDRSAVRRRRARTSA